MKLRCLALLCATSLALTACGGTKLVKQAPPVPVRETPLAVAEDTQLAAALGFVIVRNGPGAWAKNGDWDEYLLRLHNTSNATLQVVDVQVVDSGGHAATPLSRRAQLVKASKQTTRRYRQSGIKVMAGRGGTSLVAAGVGAGVVGYGAAVAATTSAALGAGGAAGGGAAGAAAGGLILAAPVLIGVGIVRAINNGKVDNAIETRATPLPASLAAGATAELDLFYPISPSPQRITISYRDDAGDHQLAIDTRQALAGLHLPAPARQAPNAAH
ncbi:MAG TPA: hypothetical protein VN205_08155 [Thermomonas sp.]|nr:hypothetical protein [Thermomonas sp.]